MPFLAGTFFPFAVSTILVSWHQRWDPIAGLGLFLYSYPQLLVYPHIHIQRRSIPAVRLSDRILSYVSGLCYVNGSRMQKEGYGYERVLVMFRVWVMLPASLQLIDHVKKALDNIFTPSLAEGPRVTFTAPTDTLDSLSVHPT